MLKTTSHVLLVTFTSLVLSCSRNVPLTEVKAEKGAQLNENSVTLTLATENPNVWNKRITMEVTKVEYPLVHGIQKSVETLGPDGNFHLTSDTQQEVTVDLRQVAKAEIRNGAGYVVGTILTVVGVSAAIVLALVLIAVLTKACPMLYVDRGSGLEFAGVPYAGAVLKSIQRDDLLPLQSLPSGTVKVKLINGGVNEIDYTDRAELVVVDHGSAQRALATHDAQVLLIGKLLTPKSVVDLQGVDRRDLVLSKDGKAWQTDLDAASKMKEPPLREGLEATFDVKPGDELALQLVAGTTPWIDLVFANYMSLFGDKLKMYYDRFADTERRAEALAWRDRQGVDLRIEWFQGGQWKQIGHLPTPGPMREVAIPLPAVTDKSVRIRVSGGTGFWTIDQLALAPVAGTAVVQRIAPSIALDKAGKDQRQALAATDGVYQALPETGEALQLSFDLQPPAKGMVRDAFFSASGYYNVGQIKQAKFSPAKLVSIGDQPGSLAKFSVELYSEYEHIALNSAKVPVTAHARNQ